MLDLDGATGVADAAQTFRFTNPNAGKSIDDLPPICRCSSCARVRISLRT